MPDGHTRLVTKSDLQPGVIFRMTTFNELTCTYATSPFSDMVLLGERLGFLKFARPYCYASSIETTSPTPLMGYEVFEVAVEQFLGSEKYHVVLMSTGKPAKWVT